MIKVQHLTKTYGKKGNTFVALKNVSCIIPDGASVAVIGKSGSGKSTLMHAMSGLDRPEKGSVMINDHDILTMSQKAVDSFRAKTIGFIFQSFFVQANESVFDNVSLPLEIARVPWGQRKTRIEKALRDVELLDKVKSRAKDLSGGQKQRLAIARAIVNNPSVVFADEPTGNLDSETGAKIEKLLFDYNKNNGATLIIVTHDEDLANQCDMQIGIKDGAIASIRQQKTTREGAA